MLPPAKGWAVCYRISGAGCYTVDSQVTVGCNVVYKKNKRKKLESDEKEIKQNVTLKKTMLT